MLTNTSYYNYFKTIYVFPIEILSVQIATAEGLTLLLLLLLLLWPPCQRAGQRGVSVPYQMSPRVDVAAEAQRLGWHSSRITRSLTRTFASYNFNKQQRKNEQGKHLDIYGDYFLWPEVKPFLHDKFFFIVEVYISKSIMEIKSN